VFICIYAIVVTAPGGSLWHTLVMNKKDPKHEVETVASDDTDQDNATASEAADRTKEIGGRGGLDPTRYGDWEKAGRCIDF
jgi:hypothetical protein